MHILIKLFLLSYCLMFPALPVKALNQDEAARLAEDYIENLDTAKARFTQIAPDGSRQTGTFYLKRPGKMRFEYDPPNNDFIVANGTFIFFYDSEMDQQSNAPIGTTLADLFLRRDLGLGEKVSVREVREFEEGGWALRLAKKAEPESGSLILYFQSHSSAESPEQSPQLKGWKVVDSFGQVTEIHLNSLETDVQLDKSLFYYRDPTPDRRLNE